MNDSTKNNDSLRKTLQTWQVSNSLPPRFQEKVWRRIARGQAERARPWWAGVADWFEAALPRPAVAASYIATLVMLGLVAGWWQTKELKSRWDGQMVVRYVQAVDPFQRIDR